ncbi:MAG: cellulase family glycosylhydrolase, partial [Sedimentisphaerales bacterium]
MKSETKRAIKAIIVCMFLCSIMPLYGATPWLHVEGNQIKDPVGNRVILRGISLIDLGKQETSYGSMKCKNVIDLITNKSDSQGSSPGWYPKVVRLPISPPEYGSPWTYVPGSDSFYNGLLRPVVDYCKQKDVYCIIDLHYVDPINKNPTYVEQFWTYMSQKFANDSHVLFELFNEPSNCTGHDAADWATVRPYMQQWTDLVRSYAPHNLILVGTPCWCQVQVPTIANPITGGNIVYVVHTYYSQWKWPSYYMSQMSTTAAVHPLIQTEWGFSQSAWGASDGNITSYGLPLSNFRELYKISNTAWVASTDWGPPMFWPGWTLRVGEGEM